MYKVEYLRKNFEDRYNTSEKLGKLIGSIIFNLDNDFSVEISERVIRNDGKVVDVDLTPLQIEKIINRNYVGEKLTITIYDENMKLFRNIILEETKK